MDGYAIFTTTPIERGMDQVATRLALSVAISLGALIGLNWPAGGGADLSGFNTGKFGICHTGGGTNCVVDGDTAWIAGERVRIADIDAPETHPPRCKLERELGWKATYRLQALLNAGSFKTVTTERETDQYGRKLRVLMRDGRSIGGQLVGEGLARKWEGRRRAWC